ncbi:MAG TPA: OmpA family protein [Bacteroidales bacterium]|nr:OmpA family protein [Bacteroidales bacterium]
MKHTIASIIGMIILFSTTSVDAQEMVDIKRREFKIKDQKEGFKEAWKSIKDGNDYYEEGIGTFHLALDHYLFADQYNSSNAELNYKIGICYLYGDDKIKSLDYFLKAYELKADVSHEILLQIGRAYHHNLEFDKAKKFYLQYKSSLEMDEEIIQLSASVDKLIAECASGKEIIQSPKRVMLQNLGENVNSPYDDYNPRFSYGDTALFFTSRRPFDKRSKRNPVDNKYNEDIYISSLTDGEYGPARRMDKPFYTKGNESIVGIAPDGESVFMYVGAKNGGEIKRVYFRSDKGKWKRPKSLPRRVRSDFMETTTTLSPDGSKLYFVSANDELSVGGKDIFVSELNEKGKWSEPKGVGGVINSKYDEEGVYLANNGKTLYFASKGHNTMGGYDIFKSDLEERDYWGQPENLGYPINTPDDEVFYVTDSSDVYGYYSTIREGGFGGKDLYKVVMLGSEKEVIALTKNDLIAGFEYNEIDPFLTVPELLQVDTSLLVSGLVRDTVGGSDTVVMAGLTFIDIASGEIAKKTMSGKDGTYKVRLPEAKTYGVEINATGYLYFLDILDLSGHDTDELAEADFYLQRIEVGTKVVLDNIYFETGKSVLTVDSYEALDQVVQLLEDNSSVKIEIAGHTDNTGSKSVNKRLSEARAKAVMDYIVGRGISNSRLEYAGYADEQPVAPNDTPEGREMNRRVEFEILSK